MFPYIHPKQYLVVKAKLQWYTTLVLGLIGLLFYLFLLPDWHRRTVDKILGQVPSSSIGYGFIMVLFGFLGWLLIFGFEIHDKVYDRYFTKWRFYYDLDFVLPTLVRPFTHKLDRRFFECAKNNRYVFMKLFYDFVEDYEHKRKIKENRIVRFYEAITKYWITQINEILLFFLLLLTFACYFVYSSLALSLNTIVNINFIIAILFLINRYFVRRSKETVRLATTDEIEDIHNNFSNELEEELKKLHERFELRYGQN